MTFNVGDAISEAIERLTTSAAAVLIVGLTVVGVAQTAALQTILRGFLEWVIEQLNDPELTRELSASEIETAEEQLNAYIDGLPLALDVSPAVAALLWLIAFVAALAIVAIAIDAFANERDGLDELETGGVGRKTLHLLLGWIAFTVLFAIGLGLFVVPGLLVALFLVYFAVAIVVDDESFVSAFGSSYDVVRSNPVGTLAIVLLCLGTFVAVWVVRGILAGGVSSAAGAVVAELITAVGQVFVLALVTRAYVGATGDDGDESIEQGTDWETDAPSGSGPR